MPQGRVMARIQLRAITAHCENNTWRVFLFEDDKDSIVQVTKPQIPENLKSVLAGLVIYFG